MGLRVEEDFAVADVIGGGAAEIGHGQVVKVLFLAQHIGALVIDVEEVLQIGKGVGRAHLLHAFEGQGDAIALAQREHQLGFERALDMQVKLGLGQGGNKCVERGNGVAVGHGEDSDEAIMSKQFSNKGKGKAAINRVGQTEINRILLGFPRQPAEASRCQIP